MRRFILAAAFVHWLAFGLSGGVAQTSIPIAEGYARTKVNMTIFRHNALCTFQNRQVASFYDPEGTVVLAERLHGQSEWKLHRTEHSGRVTDAHNSISMAFDGNGILHVSWDHHGHPLKYCRSADASSLILKTPESMTETLEERVTYPEFYRLASGDLLFFYRDGSSGNGNLVLNRFDVKTQKWHRLHDNLIDGEGQRNAYWQVATGSDDVIHLSWVWRETGDVTTNHDLCHAVSSDGGITWKTMTGAPLSVPVTATSADYAARIPQNSELSNQTTMAVDTQGDPHIALFHRPAPDAVPQYFVVSWTGSAWVKHQVGERTLNFFRRGGGTKRPPISRPVLVVQNHGDHSRAVMLFRDQERGGGITAATCDEIDRPVWNFTNLTDHAVGQADPLIDIDFWKSNGQIHVLSQFVGQGDGEKEEDVPPQMVSVIEWSPFAGK
ncbi:MAG: BNR repeat-containing protein [Planctomycetaceae bacterium]|nr:BNR repeat-containing protein [Planctomycetaceae bacterium]